MTHNTTQNLQSQEDILRPYQQEAVDAVIKNSQPGARLLVVMPTGAGKSLVIAKIAREYKNVQVLILTPRRRLLQQGRKKLDFHGVLSSNIGNDLGKDHKLIIGTFQTVMKRIDMETPLVIIIDECHLVPSNSGYSRLLDRFPDAVVIGLTATPFRGRTKIVHCGLQWELIHSVSIKELIERGWLVPPRSMSTPSNVQLHGDDFGQRDAVTKMIVPVLVNAVRKEDRRKCLVFCADIAHAELTVDLLNKSGENQVHLVHSKQSKRFQDKQFIDFEKSTDRSWLVNVGLVSIGVDIPAVDCIAILRDICSFALLVQIIGRGLRLFQGKMDCLIYDFGSGTHRFGFVDDPKFGDTTHAGHQNCPKKSCPSCGALMHVSAIKCARCSFDFPTLTTLHTSASATQLLSAVYGYATYDFATVTPQGITHHLYTQEERLHAIEVRKGCNLQTSTAPEQGQKVLIKRLSLDTVAMLGWQLESHNGRTKGRRAHR